MADSGSHKNIIRVGILTVSDSCFRKSAEDRSGSNLRHLIEEKKILNGKVVVKDVVSDEEDSIRAKLVEWCDVQKLDLVLTTGGTGFAARDVTPEATKSILEKEALGMAIAMIKQSLDVTPLAMLSRLVCGIRGSTLILNLPGSTKGAEECLQFALPGIPHAVDLLRGHTTKVTATHKELQSPPQSHKDREKKHEDNVRCCHQERKHSRKSVNRQNEVKRNLKRVKDIRQIVYSPRSDTFRQVKECSFLGDTDNVCDSDRDIDSEDARKRDDANKENNAISSTKCAHDDGKDDHIFCCSEIIYIHEKNSQLSALQNANIIEMSKQKVPRYEKPSYISSRQFLNSSEAIDILSRNENNCKIMADDVSLANMAPKSVESIQVESPFHVLSTNQIEVRSMSANTNFSIIEKYSPVVGPSHSTGSLIADIGDPRQTPTKQLGKEMLSGFETFKTICEKDNFSSDIYVTEENNDDLGDNDDDDVDDVIGPQVSINIGNHGSKIVCDNNKSYKSGLDTPWNVGSLDQNVIIFADEDENDQRIDKISKLTNENKYTVCNDEEDEATIPYVDDFCDADTDNSDSEGFSTSEITKSETEIRPIEEEQSQRQLLDMDVYDFEREHELMSPPRTQKVIRSKKQITRMKKTLDPSSPILHARLHKTSEDGEILYIDVGPAVRQFLQQHKFIQGIYLNKGKRHVKKNYVQLRRQRTAVDKGSWQRGCQIHDRNRLDDYFELTKEGKLQRESILVKSRRDEYVVNWYIWCPGHGNCLRRCGGFGACIKDCKGMKHKQDRHNCSLMINFKLFLSDLTKWRVQITGRHVPDDTIWKPPSVEKRMMEEFTKDKILSFVKTETTAGIHRILLRDNISTTNKKKICRFKSSLKKRREERCYNVRESLHCFAESGESDEQTAAGMSENNVSDTLPECSSLGPVTANQTTGRCILLPSQQQPNALYLCPSSLSQGIPISHPHSFLSGIIDVPSSHFANHFPPAFQPQEFQHTNAISVGNDQSLANFSLPSSHQVDNTATVICTSNGIPTVVQDLNNQICVENSSGSGTIGNVIVTSSLANYSAANVFERNLIQT